MKLRVICFASFLIVACWIGRAAAWGHAGGGGGWSHSYGSTGYSNEFGSSTSHTWGQGTEHTNAYGGSTSHAYGEGQRTATSMAEARRARANHKMS